MVTLVQGDEMLVQSYTEDLSPDNRLSALRRLLKTWERIDPGLTDEHRKAFATTRDIIKWIAQNKGKRNQIAHWIWVRVDDESLFGWKHHTMPTEGDENLRGQTMTVDQLLEFSREIGDQEGRLDEVNRVLRSLPAWPPARPSNEIPPVPGLASLLSPYRRRE